VRGILAAGVRHPGHAGRHGRRPGCAPGTTAISPSCTQDGDIDLHNRTAHTGISLLPAFRGRSLGTDAIRVLCRYGFAIRGLHRLQAETLADNDAMIQAALRAGFVREGTLRRSAWVNGDFTDEVILGLLATEWKAS
jgi:RimJ/RimL family protein N-acetyltransferase